MGHIFISYSRRDSDVAGLLYDRLRSSGRKAWLDKRSIPVGASYAEEIVKAIDRADAVVLLLSENANTSRDIHREIQLASNEDIRIFPLRLAEIEYHPVLKYHLSATQWVDGTEDLDLAVAELLDALGERGLGPLIPSESEAATPSDPRPDDEGDSSPTRQDALAAGVLRHFPDAVIKKINTDQCLDIHLPSVHRSRGSHLYFHTSRPGLRLGFFVRDSSFVSSILVACPDLKVMSNGLRPAGDPRYMDIDEAIAAVVAFVDLLRKSKARTQSDSGGGGSNRRPTRQDRLATIIKAHYPDAVVKTINERPYVSIHLPTVHPRWMTHLGFGTQSAAIRFSFYVRDMDYISRVVSAIPAVEGNSFGLRLAGNPKYETVEEAAEAALEFVAMLIPHRPMAD